MRVYLKHGDPVAEGSLGAGMNKTLMAHKTQRALILPAGPATRGPRMSKHRTQKTKGQIQIKPLKYFECKLNFRYATERHSYRPVL